MSAFFRAGSTVRAYQAGLDALSASAKAREASGQVEFLRADIEKLLMITEALWSILKENHGYSDDELMARVEKIDMRDGRLDGKVAKSPPTACPACGRTLVGNRPACLYCGQAVQRGPFERH